MGKFDKGVELFTDLLGRAVERDYTNGGRTIQYNGDVVPQWMAGGSEVVRFIKNAISGGHDVKTLNLPQGDYILEAGDKAFSSINPGRPPERVKLPNELTGWDHGGYIISPVGSNVAGEPIDSWLDGGLVNAFTNLLRGSANRMDVSHLRDDAVHRLQYGANEYAKLMKGGFQIDPHTGDRLGPTDANWVYPRPADTSWMPGSPAVIDQILRYRPSGVGGSGGFVYNESPYMTDLGQMSLNPMDKFEGRRREMRTYSYKDANGEQRVFYMPTSLSTAMSEFGPEGILHVDVPDSEVAETVMRQAPDADFTTRLTPKMNAFMNGKQIVNHPRELIGGDAGSGIFTYNYHPRADGPVMWALPMKQRDLPPRILGVISPMRGR